MEESQALLKHLGLTEYEARALLVLLKYGKCVAERISTLGGIPLPRVYDTMTALAEKGMVIISRTRPQTFRAVEPKRFFEILKQDEKRKVKEKIDEIDEIIPKFLKITSNFPQEHKERESEEILAYVKRRSNIGKIWKDIQSETKEEFLVFGGDLSWINSGLIDMKNSIKKGIKYKILSCKNPRNFIKNAKKAMKIGAEIRFHPNIHDIRGVIADGKKVYLIQKSLKPNGKEIKEGIPWSEEIANYKSIMINSNLISSIFRNYFYLLWKNAKGPVFRK